MNKLFLSVESKQDISDIKKYISEELQNPVAAERIIRDITTQIESLINIPKKGTPLTVVFDIETNYRFLVCGHYVVFYRYENQTILIVRVLYGRRNFEKILFQ